MYPMFIAAAGILILLTVLEGLPVRSFSAKKVSTRSDYRPSHNALPMMENFAAFIAAADEGDTLKLELVRSLGTQLFPAAIGVSFFNALQKQVSDTKELIAANKESTDKQLASNKEIIAANKESTDKQLASNKESTDKQLASNKELIAANKEITNFAISAFENKIEGILRDFVAVNRKEK